MSEKKGFFARLREGMSKSREQIAAVTEDALQADAPIDEDLYDALLDAHDPFRHGRGLRRGSAGKAAGDRQGAEAPLRRRQAKTALKEILVGMLEVEKPVLKWPMVILMVGVNGVGKTTTIGKLALRFQGLGTHDHSLRGRYLPRRRCRPAAGLVGTRPLSHRAPQGGGRPRRRGVRRRAGRQGPARPIC